MKKSFIKNAVSFRFRRWSRKSYAIFSGLHKVISIGHVSASISDKALIKNNLLTLVSAVLTEIMPYTIEEEEREPELLTTQLLSQVIILPAKTDFAADHLQFNYLSTQGWKRV